MAVLLLIESAPFRLVGLKFGSGDVYPGESLGARRGGTLGRPYSGQRTASKRAPSSAPFGGTFPLKGGRLDGKGPLIRLALASHLPPKGKVWGEAGFAPGALVGKPRRRN